MKDKYISLCTDSDALFFNMRIMQAEYPAPATSKASVTPRDTHTVIGKSDRPQVTLAEFDTSVNPDDSLIKRTAYWMIGEVKRLDAENAEKYNVYYDEYSSNECSVSISANSLTSELINRFSFNISIRMDSVQDSIAKIYINGLYVNKKYNDVGSKLLDIAKTAVRSLANLSGCKMGLVELFSVETAVLFYIKNGFVVKDLFWQTDPQNKVYSTQKMIEFAIKEDNIEIVKKYAKVTSDNFLDFVKYLIENTKYGKYFTTYFEELDNPDEVERSIMQSRFISSIFTTHMIYAYVRDNTKPKVSLKPLAM